MLKKIFIYMVCSITLIPISVSAYDDGFIHSSMSIGGDSIFNNNSSTINTQQPTEIRSYTGAVTERITPASSIVINNSYPTTPYYGVPVTTYRIGPYSTNYRGYYPGSISSSYSNVGVSNRGNFAFNYTGHAYNYGSTSRSPIYVNNPVYNPPPPPIPPQNNGMPPSQPGAFNAGFHYNW